MLQQDELDNLIACLDKPLDSIQELFDKLKSTDKHYQWHAPMDEDIETTNDEWEGHYFEELGVGIETQCAVISHVSFFLKFSKHYKPNSHEKNYDGLLPFGLSVKMRKPEVHLVLGEPLKSAENLDQYHLDGELILGLIYDDDNEWLRIASIGSKRIFSDENLYPNRYSDVCHSLYNIEESISEEME